LLSSAARRQLSFAESCGNWTFGEAGLAQRAVDPASA